MARKRKKAERNEVGPLCCRYDWLWALALIVATILAYQQAWTAGYIWDDDKYVTENKLLTAPDGLKRIWFSLDSPSQYFPLVYTTFRWEHALWGLHPAGYHWVNILLHAANALLVWRLLRGLAVPGAWLAAAFFALHPVHVESVAWITERKNVLMGLFFLLSLLAWNRFIDAAERTKWNFYALALFAYALALFSKTTACTLPAALLLMLWLRRKPINWARVLQIVPFVVLGLAMGLVSIWWERHHQGTQGQLFEIGLIERVLIASRAVWFYLAKLLWPADLAFSYPRWDVSAADPLDYLWPALAIALAFAIYLLRRRAGRGPEVALLFFAATLAPMLGFIMLYTFRYSFVADHYQYLASVGPLALAASALTIGFRSLDRTRGLLCGGVLLALGLLTWRQCGIYKDEETLWRATIATNPQSWMAHNNLAIKRVQAGATEEGIAHYEKALELDPTYAEAHFNFGNALVRTDRPEDAIARYEKALEFYPEFAAAKKNLGTLRRERGVSLLQENRASEAVLHLRKAAEADAENAESHFFLGNALLAQQQLEEAMRSYARAVELKPGYARAHNNLANTLFQLGRLEEAIAQYEDALRVDPGYATAHYNLARVLARVGREEEAQTHAARAAELDAKVRQTNPPQN